MNTFMSYRNINERIMCNMSYEHEGRKHQLNLGEEVMVLPDGTADGTLELGLESSTLPLLLLIPHPFFLWEPLFPQKCLIPCRPGCC